MYFSDKHINYLNSLSIILLGVFFINCLNYDTKCFISAQKTPDSKVRMLPNLNTGRLSTLIKENVLISTIVSDYVDKKYIKRSSASSFVCLCPFHDDRNPSMSVNDIKGLYHCFSCKASGDTIGFVQNIEKISYMEALRKIVKISGNNKKILSYLCLLQSFN